jgi:hypothetical protein
VGFFGNSMLVRADVDVTALDVIRDAGGEPDGGWVGRAGWRFARVHRGKPLTAVQVRAVADQLGAPFLAAYVVDSDFAEVRCAAPGMSVLRFVLQPLYAADYECPVDSQAQETAVPYLLRWAGEGADEALLRATVQGSLTFAEDSVVRLAAAIGAIAPSDLENYMFGPIEDIST